MTPAEIDRYLAEHIPVTSRMGISTVRYGRRGFELRAPLGLNTNHRSTVFGGSLATLAITAGWATVHFRLTEHCPGAKTVIQTSSMEYERPATGTVTALCHAPPASEWDRFLRTLERRSRARIGVEVILRVQEEVVARFRASYVALFDPASAPSAS